jgi:hypothetical protein
MEHFKVSSALHKEPTGLFKVLHLGRLQPCSKISENIVNMNTSTLIAIKVIILVSAIVTKS